MLQKHDNHTSTPQRVIAMPSPQDRGTNVKTLHSLLGAKAKCSDAHSPIVASIADVQSLPYSSDKGMAWPRNGSSQHRSHTQLPCAGFGRFPVQSPIPSLSQQVLRGKVECFKTKTDAIPCGRDPIPCLVSRDRHVPIHIHVISRKGTQNASGVHVQRAHGR